MKLEIINALLPQEDETDRFHLIAENGRWTSIVRQDNLQKPTSPPEKQQGKDQVQIDASDHIVVPGFVDGHVHLDKAHTLAIATNQSGTLHEAIQSYRKHAPGFSKEDVKRRMKRTIYEAVSFGTMAIRTHLDFFTGDDGSVAKQTLEAALEVKKEVRGMMDVQLFVMCDPVILEAPFNSLLREGLAMGIDGIGGAPHLSPDFEESVKALFALSDETGKPLDLHSDETDDPDVNTVSMIAEEVIKRGMQHQVTVGHLCSLAAMDQVTAEQTMALIHRAGLHVMTLPGANMYLQGRSDKGLIRRGVTRVKELHEHGVNVAVGSDNIQDPFHPYGHGDLLEIGRLSTYAAHMNGVQERLATLKMITENPARALGYKEKEYGINIGSPANCVITESESVAQLLADLSPNRTVIRNGERIAETKRQVNWFHASECHIQTDEHDIK